MIPMVRPVPSPVPLLAALGAAALLAGALPGTRWSDTAALLALVAALFAGHERRMRDMLVAAGLATGLAPVGLLLAPLCVGLAIRHRAVRHVPIACLTMALTHWALPWPMPGAALPNLSALMDVWPDGIAIVVAIGAGLAAWLVARASMLPSAALPAEARLGTLLLAIVLPLPLAALGFILMMAALPWPAARQLCAANDNVVDRRIVRLAA